MPDKAKPVADAGLVHRLKRWRDDFRAWQRRNREALARSPTQACCSAPPPGATAHDKRTGK